MEEVAIASNQQMNIMFIGLFQLVMLSLVLERALFVLFDVAWWRERIASGWKSMTSITVAVLICFHMDFDLLSRIIELSGRPTPEGQFVTGLIVSGGSAGAKRLMQDFLMLGREQRELTKKQLAYQAAHLATQ